MMRYYRSVDDRLLVLGVMMTLIGVIILLLSS